MTFWFWAALTAGWFGGMIFLSHQDGPHTGEVSRTVAQELHPFFPAVDTESLNRILRQAAHTLLFAGLTVLMGITLDAGELQPIRALVFGMLLLWCWADEATKQGVPGRHFSWRDVGLNALGTLCGGVVFWTL